METEEEARGDGGQAARRGQASKTVTGIYDFSLLGCWYCTSVSSLSLGTVLRFSSSSLNELLYDDFPSSSLC